MEVLNEALISSCKEGHLDVVKWFRGHTAADVNYKSREVLWLNTTLIAACFNGYLHIVKYLQEACHADVNLPNGGGYTSLTQMCCNTRMSFSKYLLSEVSNLEVNIAESYGHTALRCCVWSSKDDNTPLHEACDSGDATEVKMLVLAKGRNIYAQDNVGNTPLHKACEYGLSDIVITLMLAGS